MQLPGLLRDVVDFCYPPTCAACREPSRVGGFLCDRCDATLVELEAEVACPRCAARLAMPGLPCLTCGEGGLRPYERVVAIGRFVDPLPHLIHQIKYHGRWHVAEQLAERMLGLERVRALLAEADVLLPVPLHRVRQVLRGYNQAEVIAASLAARCRLKLIRPIRRRRYTPTQTRLHARVRRYANLRGAFELVDAEVVRGRRVVVIDDVLTTGATLQTLARALRAARPAALSALVLAVANPRDRRFRKS